MQKINSIRPFVFQKFTVLQRPDVFRVGTDGVLIGALCSVAGTANVLEVGTGSGLISLMIAQRNPLAQIIALDIEETASNLAQENFRNSSFADRLTVHHADFKEFSCNKTFDLIVCNPPFFEPNSSTKDVIARQTVQLDASAFMRIAAQFLSESGRVSVIIPAEQQENYIKSGEENKLFPARIVRISGIEGGNVKRCVLEFSRIAGTLNEETLTIEKSPRKYSDQYLELTKEFHVFKK